MGLGWIALLNDRNDKTADTIFRFVHSKNPLPDALFKLEQMAEQRGDSGLQLRYARHFASEATRPVYGGVYNKNHIHPLFRRVKTPATPQPHPTEQIAKHRTPHAY